MDVKRKHAKTIQMAALLAAAAGLFLVLAAPAQQAHAQYGVGGSTTGAPSEEQLQKCEEYEIPRSECTENTILAKERLIHARQNPGLGSGTSFISTSENETWLFVGVLGAIFGGVAAAFFAKGRGASK